MFILFLIVLNSSGSSVSSSNARFESEISCLKAIEKLLTMEKQFGIRVQARCVKGD